jgi:hypothetical protein
MIHLWDTRRFRSILGRRLRFTHTPLTSLGGVWEETERAQWVKGAIGDVVIAFRGVNGVDE